MRHKTKLECAIDRYRRECESRKSDQIKKQPRDQHESKVDHALKRAQRRTAAERKYV